MKISKQLLSTGLSIKKMLAHESNYTKLSSRDVQYIVVHYTGNTSDRAVDNAAYFAGANRGCSAHLFVDDNAIYLSVPMNSRAWHCGDTSYWHPYCRNNNSIGIEMCCSGNYKVSEATKAQAIELVAALCKQMGIKAKDVDSYVLRHYDVTGKNCPAQMAGSNNTEWKEFKVAIEKALGGVTEEIKETEEVCEVKLPVLGKGDNGNTVKALQRMLIYEGYNCGGYGADGDFGNGTEKSVKKYQADKKLTADGIVGEKTWAKLLGV